jgi:hypothetical protein
MKYRIQRKFQQAMKTKMMRRAAWKAMKMKMMRRAA